MTTQDTSPSKQVIVTKADFERLSELVKSSHYKATFSESVAALKDELSRVQIVEVSDIPRNIVTMRAQVVVRDVKSDESETYTLVYPDEADIDKGRLSVLAPLGIALLGEKTGHSVSFATPAGKRRVKIGKVLYQPEASGHFDL